MFIMGHARLYDKDRGFAPGDLTKNFVRDLISKPCDYCGDEKSKMTLDRIDNDLGHTKANVVPACVRCNYLRRDMPFEAWKELASAIRRVRELGLFGDWVGDTKKRIK
jgi:hypothetical protein